MLTLCFTVLTSLVPARRSELTEILFTVKQFGLMLLFTFELKHTRIFNTTDVTPFHVRYFLCYNGMTSLGLRRETGFGYGGWR